MVFGFYFSFSLFPFGTEKSTTGTFAHTKVNGNNKVEAPAHPAWAVCSLRTGDVHSLANDILMNT